MTSLETLTISRWLHTALGKGVRCTFKSNRKRFWMRRGVICGSRIEGHDGQNTHHDEHYGEWYHDLSPQQVVPGETFHFVDSFQVRKALCLDILQGYGMASLTSFHLVL